MRADPPSRAGTSSGGVSPRSGLSRTGALAGLLIGASLAAFGALLSQAPRVAAGEVLIARAGWVRELGLSLSFRLDGLSLLFGLLVTGIGALIFLYADGYFRTDPRRSRMLGLLGLFAASMLGLVLAENLLCLFVFWELTSISSYFLIGFDHRKEEARGAALQALLLTAGGGLALLAGLVVLGGAAGTFEMTELLQRGDQVLQHPHNLAALLLVAAGALTKSAQFPFHFWLPAAMAAPTPASAYLHSATMVKAGVYLLARLHPVLSGTPAWEALLVGAGAATMLTGAVLGFTQSDLKRILAYSTISALGMLVFLLGIGSPVAVQAAMVLTLAHALYKAALFMVAGAIEHGTGTRDADRLGGLRRAMPYTAAAGVMAAVGLASLGPALSFIGKELLLEAVLEEEALRNLWVVLVTVVSGLLAAVAAVVGLKPFFGAPREALRDAHEVPAALWLGPMALALLSLLIGLRPGAAASYLIGPAAGAVLGRGVPVQLALWHGVNLPLVLSAASLLLGAALYWRREWLRERLGDPSRRRWSPARLYERAWAGVLRFATFQTQVLQTGYLRVYVMVTVVCGLLLIGGPIVLLGFPPAGRVSWTDPRAQEVILALVMLIAAGATAILRSRLGAVVSLGVVGYALAVLFVLFGAPDLAMAQFLVETLTVVLFVLVFHHLPPILPKSPAGARVRDAMIALGAGLVMATLVIAALLQPVPHGPAQFYVAQSVPAAHGRNIVNVILVDFRALDTLGEITVLAVAGLGVYALLKLNPVRRSRR
ncbi:MAG: hydrogen gas-evolving membrane-bound hydrogenase subunit E [Armatimonadota bacterium]